MTDLPAFFARRGALAEAATAGIGAARPPHVSRRGNRFTLVDGAGNEKPVETFHLDVVIVGVNRHPSKMFFSGPYDDANSGPPDCWSDNGSGPSQFAANPQSKTCMLCPHNSWGTGPRGTGRACQDSKKLAVMVVGDDSGLVYEFKVPPGSFNSNGDSKIMGWTQYVTSIKGFMIGNRKADLFDVVTRITFVPNNMGVLSFAPVSLVTDVAGLMERFSTLTDEAVDIVTGVNDVARDPNAPIEVQQKSIAPSVQPVNAPLGIAQQAIEKRHRATKAEMEARRAAQAPTRPVQASASTDMGEVPPFLQRAPAPAAAPAAPQNGGAQFGIQANPLPPPAKLTDALNKAFNLKTG